MFITLFLISTDMCLRTNVPFQYTISGDREQVFLLYYKDFFEQICSDVQFISPPEEVGEFLLHLLKSTSLINAILADKRFIAMQKNLKVTYEVLLPEKSIFPLRN